MATHRSDLRDVPITVDPSVGCEQVSGGINKIEGGQRQENVIVLDAIDCFWLEARASLWRLYSVYLVQGSSSVI